MIIEGFKSYKDQTIAEPFSPKINVVGGSPPGAMLPESLLLISLLTAPRAPPLCVLQSGPTAPASPTSSMVRGRRDAAGALAGAGLWPPPRAPLSAAQQQSLTSISALCSPYLPAAVRFVLNDLFTTLRQEERQRLLHVRGRRSSRSSRRPLRPAAALAPLLNHLTPAAPHHCSSPHLTPAAPTSPLRLLSCPLPVPRRARGTR